MGTQFSEVTKDMIKQSEAHKIIFTYKILVSSAKN